MKRIILVFLPLFIAGCAHLGFQKEAPSPDIDKGVVLAILPESLGLGEPDAREEELIYLLQGELTQRERKLIPYRNIKEKLLQDTTFHNAARQFIKSLVEEGEVSLYTLGDFQKGLKADYVIIVGLREHLQEWRELTKLTKISLEVKLFNMRTGKLQTAEFSSQTEGPLKGFSYVRRKLAQEIASSCP